MYGHRPPGTRPFFLSRPPKGRVPALSSRLSRFFARVPATPTLISRKMAPFPFRDLVPHYNTFTITIPRGLNCNVHNGTDCSRFILLTCAREGRPRRSSFGLIGSHELPADVPRLIEPKRRMKKRSHTHGSPFRTNGAPSPICRRCAIARPWSWECSCSRDG